MQLCTHEQCTKQFSIQIVRYFSKAIERDMYMQCWECHELLLLFGNLFFESKNTIFVCNAWRIIRHWEKCRKNLGCEIPTTGWIQQSKERNEKLHDANIFFLFIIFIFGHFHSHNRKYGNFPSLTITFIMFVAILKFFL